MKKHKKLIIFGALLLVLCVAATLLVAGILKKNKEGRTLEDPVGAYRAAVDKLGTEGDHAYRVTSTKERIVGNEIFQEVSHITVTVENGERYLCSTEETLQVGSHSVHISQVYDGSKVYMTVEGVPFAVEMSQEAWLDRLFPMVTVDAATYATVVGLEFPDRTVFTFTKATAPEGVALISADATVTLDEDGSIASSHIELNYTDKESYIRHTIITEPLPYPSSGVVLPEDTSHYTALSGIDAPRLLEIACGYLLEADSLTAQYTDEIICDAFGDRRTQDITVHAVNTNAWSSCMTTRIDVSNTGMTDAATTLNKIQLFSKGEALVKTDDQAFMPEEGTDAAAAETQCQDILVGTIALPQHIQAMTVEETEDTVTYRFTGNEDFAQLLASEASTTLYRDGVFLSALAQSYETKSVTCYLTIHKDTSLPLASGFAYSGVYTIEAIPYTLSFRADQTYDLLHDEAEAAIAANEP